jgi:DNA modification methylase
MTADAVIGQGSFESLRKAAVDPTPVKGHTHNFYRYPARFSPQFAAAAIEHFSRPGDLVLDPYMGGGTTVVEGLVSGRHVVGNDLNSLASFICKVKTTRLTPSEAGAIKLWASEEVPNLKYDLPRTKLQQFIDPEKTGNLSLARARYIKKVVAAALWSIGDLPTENAKDFARCVLLRTSQWALDGRKRHTPLPDFRDRLAAIAEEMLWALSRFTKEAVRAGGFATIINADAADLERTPIFRDKKKRADLVVTSPPYPGVHVLYHRWQVDGRRETPAPYWIANCNDGQGGSFYNFGDRREAAADDYFAKSLATLKVIRSVMEDGGYMLQLVAFNRPADQLSRYLENMEAAGFAEVQVGNRIWRQVPGRKWHARQKGKTNSSNEVVLIHRAVEVTG